MKIELLQSAWMQLRVSANLGLSAAVAQRQNADHFAIQPSNNWMTVICASLGSPAIWERLANREQSVRFTLDRRPTIAARIFN